MKKKAPDPKLSTAANTTPLCSPWNSTAMGGTWATCGARRALRVMVLLTLIAGGLSMNGSGGSGAGSGIAQGFARPRGNDVRSRPTPHPYFPFHDMLIIGNRYSGKTTILLWILMYAVTEALLRGFYTEVVIICSKMEQGLNREHSSDWSLFKHLYSIGARPPLYVIVTE